jgi:hypothetical protein
MASIFNLGESSKHPQTTDKYACMNNLICISLYFIYKIGAREKVHTSESEDRGVSRVRGSVSGFRVRRDRSSKVGYKRKSLAFREEGLGVASGRIGLALVSIDLVGPAYQVGPGVQDEVLGVSGLESLPFRGDLGGLRVINSGKEILERRRVRLSMTIMGSVGTGWSCQQEGPGRSGSVSVPGTVLGVSHLWEEELGVPRSRSCRSDSIIDGELPRSHRQ